MDTSEQPVIGGCVECAGVVQAAVVEHVPDWVRAAEVPCVQCGKPIDVWKELVSQAKGYSFFRLMLVAHTTAFCAPVPTTEAGYFFALDLTAHGVPAGATIYNVAITPEYPGPDFVQIVRSAQDHVPYPNQCTTCYLGVWPTGIDPSEIKLHIFVSWSDPGAVTFAWTRIMEAFTHVAADRLTEGLLAANVAVEHTVSSLLAQRLPAQVGPGAAKDFFDRATYSQLLGVILPMWCRIAGHPLLVDPVFGLLKRLRQLRNQIAHGKKLPSLSPSEVAELLAAAVAAVAYLETL